MQATDHTPPAARQAFNRNVHGARGLLAAAGFPLSHRLFRPAELHDSGRRRKTSLPGPDLPAIRRGDLLLHQWLCGGRGALKRASDPAPVFARSSLPDPARPLAVIADHRAAGHSDSAGALCPAGPGHDYLWILPANLLLLPGTLPLPLLHLAAWSLSYEAVSSICWPVLSGPCPGATGWAMLLLAGIAIGLIAWHPRARSFFAHRRADGAGRPGSIIRWVARLAHWPLAWLVIFLLPPGFWSRIPRQPVLANVTLIWAARWPWAASFFAWTGIVAGHGLISRALRSSGLPVSGHDQLQLLSLAPAGAGGGKAGATGHGYGCTGYAGSWSQVRCCLS